MTASVSASPVTPMARNALRLVGAFAAADVVVSTYIVYQAFQTPVWQLQVMVGVVAALMVFVSVGLGVIYRGRPALGVWLTFMPWLLVLLVTSALFANLGPLLLTSAFTVMSLIAGQTLAARPARLFTLAGVVAGILAWLVDLFIPTERLTLAGLQNVIIVVLVILAAIYGYATLRRYQEYDLSTKLIAAFLLVALVPVGLITYLNINETQQRFTATTNQALLSAAAQTAASLDNFITVNLNAVRVEARLSLWTTYLDLPPAQRAGSPSEADVVSTLSALSRKGQVFAPAYIPTYLLLDGAGQVLQATATTEIGHDQAQAAYFRVPHETGNVYLSPVEFSGPEGAAALYFSSPIKNVRGEVLGVLVVRYNAAVLQQLVLQSAGQAGTETFVILLDENHMRLAHATAPHLLYKLVMPLEAARIAELQAARRLPAWPVADLATNLADFEAGLANAATQPFFTAEVGETNEADDIPDLAAVTALKTQPWLLVYAQLQSVALAPVAVQTRNAVLYAIITGIVVASVGYLFARLLVRPVQQLAAIAQRITEGDLRAQAPITSQDEIGALAVSFNTMTSRLRTNLESLDVRAKALATSAQVSRTLSTILNPERLSAEVVQQLQEAFNYYHAHIFLLAEDGQALWLAGGTGEAGRAMLARRHTIPAGKGLVGRAAQTGEPVLVPDVRQDPGWLFNALLPETRSELAVPIAAGGRVLGVLDVQSNTVNGLGPDDVELLRAIADQLGIALQNARLYTQAQHQAERRATAVRINQRIQNATTPAEVLTVTAYELGQATGARRVHVQLTSPRRASDAQVAPEEG